jgi:hypothetical protein|tara:strand:- start:447 stop:647 length:201 start_codon:yes stop_codon:yes gene_type:complete
MRLLNRSGAYGFHANETVKATSTGFTDKVLGRRATKVWGKLKGTWQKRTAAKATRRISKQACREEN